MREAKAQTVCGGLLLLLGLMSCGPKYAGFGVFLWAERGAVFATGEVVPLVRESSLRKIFEIPSGAGKETHTVPVWRIVSFATRDEADDYAALYAVFRDWYAYSEKKGLPVRETPRQDGSIVYKLDTNEVVKVISRGDEMSTEGGYENYWYLILTSDGSTGYCFGQFLTVYQTEDDPFAVAGEYQSRDAVLDSIISRAWRPEYFEEMIKSKEYDLSRFSQEIGFFPYTSRNRILLVTEEDSRTFAYESIEKVGSATYVFHGAGLRVEMIYRNRIAVSYEEDEKLVTATYVLVQEDIHELVQEEEERREKLYEPFLGATLASSAYGTVSFDEYSNFKWEGYERLLPLFVRSISEGSGYVSFPYYLADHMVGSFDGAIVFTFLEPNSQEQVVFLYRFSDEGVKLVHVGSENIGEITVKSTGVSPLVLFFQVTQG
jgi:hypothetical protein